MQLLITLLIWRTDTTSQIYYVQSHSRLSSSNLLLSYLISVIGNLSSIFLGLASYISLTMYIYSINKNC